MPKSSQFTGPERTLLLTKARLIHRQPELDIRYRQRDPKSSCLPGRLLVITSRKIGNAVKRNLLRRRLKAIFYEEKLFSYSYDVVIYSRKCSTDLSFQELKSILLQAFSQIPTGAIQNEALY